MSDAWWEEVVMDSLDALFFGTMDWNQAQRSASCVEKKKYDYRF